MKYGNETDMCRDVPLGVQAPQESMMERMYATADLGKTVQNMAVRIRNVLFSSEEKLGEGKGPSPECLEGMLEMHRTDLQYTARVLEEICARLGV